MLANLRALFVVVFDIIRLKGGPENLPTSTALLTVVVGAFAGVTALLASSVAVAEQQARWPIELVVGIGVTLLFFHVALSLAKKRERFVQTMTALYAVRTLFVPAIMPMVSLLRVDPTNPSAPAAPAALGILFIALVVWMVAAEVRIVRSAFEWAIGGALGLVIAQEFAVVVVFVLVLGISGVKAV